MKTFLWLLASAACLSLTVLLCLLPVSVGREAEGWEEAAAHVARKIKPQEAVVVHPAGEVADAAPFLLGFPCMCDPKKKTSTFESLRASGLWIVGTKKPDGALKKARSAWGKSGTAKHSDVLLHHYWGPLTGRGKAK